MALQLVSVFVMCTCVCVCVCVIVCAGLCLFLCMGLCTGLCVCMGLCPGLCVCTGLNKNLCCTRHTRESVRTKTVSCMKLKRERKTSDECFTERRACLTHT